MSFGIPSFSDIKNAVTNTVNSATSTVTNTATNVRDLGVAALDKTKELAADGVDLGRRAVEATRSFDVREAASVVRAKISEGTEAARDGIKTGVEYAGRKTGEAADFARTHVPGGDNVLSNGIRGAITVAEDSTRFQLGVVGGVTREVVGLAGTVGQLGTTAAEMQLSPEARIEYGQKIVDGATHAAQATGSYLESAVRDPSRIGSDASNIADAGKQWAGGQIDRYQQAFSEGKGFETVGMDVGTVATYVVPVGGGPLRGALTAATRGAGEAAVRGGVEVAARSGTEALVRDAGTSVLRGGTSVSEQRGAALVQRITEGGNVARLENGSGRIADISAASRLSGRELAVYRDAASGDRLVAMGGADGVLVPAGSRVIAHTQPGVGSAALTPSAADFAGLGALGQRSSAIIDQGGNIARFGVDDAARGATARSGDAVLFQAPRDVHFADGGSIHYGALDELGRPTGVTARITPDMIGAGTPANSTIHPPGWSGNGILHNEARGHLLGRQLGGSGDLPENLVTLQQRPANSPVMSGFEARIRDAVEHGQTVDYNPRPVYVGNELTPRGVTLTATGTGGLEIDVTVLNPVKR